MKTSIYECERLGSILSADRAKAASIAENLAAMSRDELNRRSMVARVRVGSAVELGNEVAASVRMDYWLINAELTRRRVPPVLRSLPDPNEDDPAQIADLIAIDLDWLVSSYPKQKLKFHRWKGIFVPEKFHGASDYIANNYQHRQLYWFCSGLNLAEDQQREMKLLKLGRLHRAFEDLCARKEMAKSGLKAAYHARDCRYKTDDGSATVERRANIWFVGHLASWSPQRTAFYYESVCGEPITRQMAANVIAQVHRDLPDSKPRRRRSRPRKTETKSFLTDLKVLATK